MKEAVSGKREHYDNTWRLRSRKRWEEEALNCPGR